MSIPKDVELEWFRAIDDTVRAVRVDGVPVVYVGGPGPLHAGLSFRVGAADETLPQRGLTHLIEHLVLRGQISGTDHRNGMTGSTFTHFVVGGSEQQVVQFLNHVCEALRTLPIDDLDAERSILQVEAQSRQAAFDDRLNQVRYGATGFGLGSYREFGAEVATAEVVVEWARRWFVRGNAVAWLTTDSIPAGLDLRLPEGGRRPFINPPTQLAARPAWIEGRQGAAFVDAIVARSASAAMFADVLSKTLFRKLRLEGGHSYTAFARYDPLDADSARILVHADAAVDATSDMVEALAEVLLSLRDGHFDAGALADARELRRERAAQVKAAPANVLGGAALGFLLGGDSWAPDEAAALSDAVTEDDLAIVARAFWEDAIWQSPALPDRATGVVAIPPKKSALVDGIPFVHGTTSERYFFGTAGVSIEAHSGTYTVHFEDCVLALQWPDGGRTLVGKDSTTIAIEPTMLREFETDVLPKLDAAIPASAVVKLPARPSDTIPRMPPASPRGLGAWAPVTAIALVLVATVGSFPSFMDGDPVRIRNSIVGIVYISLAIVGLSWGWIRRLRWARKSANA